jgi:Na+-driven multidrug efflux pump
MNHLACRCYGEVGVSALTVVTYVQVLIMMVFMGFTSAVEPVFSYHYGSGNTKMRRKVYRLSIRWCLVLGAAIMLLLFFFRRQVIDVFFDPGTSFFDIASLGYLISLPACLFVGVNIFGSGLFTAFSNGLVSGFLSFVRTFLILTACLYGLTAFFGGPGLWSAWPAAEFVSFLVTVFFLRKYRSRYQY